MALSEGKYVKSQVAGMDLEKAKEKAKHEKKVFEQEWEQIRGEIDKLKLGKMNEDVQEYEAIMGSKQKLGGKETLKDIQHDILPTKPNRSLERVHSEKGKEDVAEGKPKSPGSPKPRGRALVFGTKADKLQELQRLEREEESEKEQMRESMAPESNIGG